MNIDLFEQNKKLDGLKKTSRDKEIIILNEIVRKYVIPKFNELYNDVVIEHIERGHIGKEKCEAIKPVSETKQPFIVIKKIFTDKKFFSGKDYDIEHKVGNLLAINEKGKFVKGSFYKYYDTEKANRKNKYESYQQFVTELRSEKISAYEFLQKISLTDFYNIIMSKLGINGVDFEKEAQKENNKINCLNEILRLLNNVK